MTPLSLINAEFRAYISALRLLRNAIVHGGTRRDSLARDPLAKLVQGIHAPSSVVPVWPTGPVDPDADLTKCVWTASLAGVVVAELAAFDGAGRMIPKGFGVVCRVVESNA